MPPFRGIGAPDTLPPLPQEYLDAIKLIDKAHSEDPNLIDGPGGPKTIPYELHYARQMLSWLISTAPNASPELQVACSAQHFERYVSPTYSLTPIYLQSYTHLNRTDESGLTTSLRWKLPRSSFPTGRTGYLTWRSKQKSVAAESITSLLTPILPEESVARIASLIRKEKLASDAETQILEDTACLVFLDDQFDDFESKEDIDEEKMVNILRKTWGKMSGRARELAMILEFSPRAKMLIHKALVET